MNTHRACLILYLIGSGILVLTLNDTIFTSQVTLPAGLQDTLDLICHQYVAEKQPPMCTHIRRSLTVVVVPASDPTTAILASLPVLVGLFIVGSSFFKPEKIIRTSGFWAVAMVLCSISLIGVHIFTDARVVFGSLIIESPYTRTYTRVGLGMLATQVLLHVVATIECINHSTNEFSKKESLLFLSCNLTMLSCVFYFNFQGDPFLYYCLFHAVCTCLAFAVSATIPGAECAHSPTDEYAQLV